MLQGPSRGEEATKKLLAIGSAAEAKTRRPRGTRENPACNKVWRAHANIAALNAAAASHSLASQVLPINGQRSTLPCHLPRLLRSHRPQRRQSLALSELRCAASRNANANAASKLCNQTAATAAQFACTATIPTPRFQLFRGRSTFAHFRCAASVCTQHAQNIAQLTQKQKLANCD